jgi:hypothetical protein
MLKFKRPMAAATLTLALATLGLAAALLVSGPWSSAWKHTQQDDSSGALTAQALASHSAEDSGSNHKGNVRVSTIDQLRTDVSQLALPKGRNVGSPGHDAARAYILDRLHQLGLAKYTGDSFELPYDDGDQHFVNIVGAIAGTNPSLPPALLAAHYDTCGPYPGADDNAAAIAILLAIAEQWRSKPAERTVLFAFFDAEEPPHFLRSSMGSIQFYRHQRTGPVHCAIVLDLVGHDVPLPGLSDLVVVTGMESDPRFPEILKSCEGNTHIRTVATLNRYIGDLSDHHAFRLDQRPYLFFTCAHWEHYHQPTDTPEKLNYEKMAALVEYLSRVTGLVCASPLEGPFEGYDSTDAELYFLRRVLGPIAETMGLRLDGRKDIDTVVDALSSHIGL